MDPGLVTPSDLQELGLNSQQIDIFDSAIRNAANGQRGQTRRVPAAAMTTAASSLASYSVASVSSATTAGASAKFVPASASSVASSQSRKSSLEEALADASLAEAEADAAEREANAAWERTVATLERSKAREAEAQALERRQHQQRQQLSRYVEDEAFIDDFILQKAAAAVALRSPGSDAAVGEAGNKMNGKNIENPNALAMKPKAVIDTSYLSSGDDDSDDDNAANGRDLVAPISLSSLSSGASFVPSISSSSSSQSSASSAGPLVTLATSPAVSSAPTAPLPTISAVPSVSSTMPVASASAPTAEATVVAPAGTVPSQQAIACPRCTLENEASATQCIMCERKLETTGSGTSSSAAQALAQMRSGLAAHDSLRGRPPTQGPPQESDASGVTSQTRTLSGNDSLGNRVTSTSIETSAGATGIAVQNNGALPSAMTNKPRLSAQGLFENVSERDRSSSGAQIAGTRTGYDNNNTDNRSSISKSAIKSVAIDPAASWLALLSSLGVQLQTSVVEELLRGNSQAATEMECVLAAAEALKAENASLKAKVQDLDASTGKTAAAETPPGEIPLSVQQDPNTSASTTTAAAPAPSASNSQRAPWMKMGRKPKGQHEPAQMTREVTEAADDEQDVGSNEEEKEEKNWSCAICTLSNEASEKACVVCGWEHLPTTTATADAPATAMVATSAGSAPPEAAAAAALSVTGGDSVAAEASAEVSVAAESTTENTSQENRKGIGDDVVMREFDVFDLNAEGIDGSNKKGNDGPSRDEASVSSSSLSSDLSSSTSAIPARRGSLLRGVRKSVAASTGLHGVFSKGTKLGGGGTTTSDRSDDDTSEAELNEGGLSGSKHGSGKKNSRRSSKADAKEAAAAALRRQKLLEAESVEAERLALFRAAASQADASLTLPQTRVRRIIPFPVVCFCDVSIFLSLFSLVSIFAPLC